MMPMFRKSSRPHAVRSRRSNPRAASKVLLALSASMTLFVTLSAQSGPPPTAGTIATRDYVAPVDIQFVDVEATVAAASATGEHLPLVVRSDPRAADDVVTDFDAAFRKTRTAYLDALAAAFGRRSISDQEIDSSRFQSFRTEFDAANPSFPVTLGLAQTWARGDDGEATRERLARALQGEMTRALIGDLRAASTVFITTLRPSDRIRNWGEASSHTRPVDRGAILSVDAAGRDLRQSLDLLDRGAGGFMAGLLHANLVADDYLTGLLLDERLGNRARHETFRAGQYIARHGEPVDRIGAVALAQLARLELAAGSGPPPSPAEAAPVPPPHATAIAPAVAAPAVQDSPRPRAALRWHPVLLVAGAAAIILLIVAFALWRGRRRPRSAASTEWLDEPAVKPAGNVREALIPHLARELKNRLVQALFAQRQALLHNEAAASQRVAILEERLARLQPAIAEKIRGYEKRIQALEAELDEKDQETRDLIRAKLVLARKELDAEITRHHINWN